MRILVVTPTFLPLIGGAELGIFEIFSRLGDFHEIKVLTPRLPEHIYRNYKSNDQYYKVSNFEVEVFEDKYSLISTLRRPILRGIVPPFSLSAFPVVSRCIREFKPDIINLHYVIPHGLGTLLAAKIKKTPVALSLVGRDTPTKATPYFWKKYISLVCRNVESTLYISDYSRRQVLAGKSKEPSDKIIPYGVDIERFSPKIDAGDLKSQLHIPSDHTVLLALQRLSLWKRTDVLVNAMPAILEHLPKTTLLIVGKGPEEARIKNAIEQLGIQQNVIVAGYVPEDDLPKYFALADIFTFHSTFETFGIVLAQAMASGKPIVSVESTAIPEVVDSGVNGTLVPPMDPGKFADAVVRLLKDPDRRRDYGTAARRKAEQKFNWSLVAQKYEQSFREILEKLQQK